MASLAMEYLHPGHDNTPRINGSSANPSANQTREEDVGLSNQANSQAQSSEVPRIQEQQNQEGLASIPAADNVSF